MTVDFTEMEMVDYDERQQILNSMSALDEASEHLNSLANKLEDSTVLRVSADDLEELIESLRFTAQMNPLSETAVYLREQAGGMLMR